MQCADRLKLKAGTVSVWCPNRGYSQSHGLGGPYACAVGPNGAGRIGCMNRQESRNQSPHLPQATKFAEDRQHCEICNKNHGTLVICYAVSSAIGEHENKIELELLLRMDQATTQVHNMWGEFPFVKMSERAECESKTIRVIAQVQQIAHNMRCSDEAWFGTFWHSV